MHFLACFHTLMNKKGSKYIGRKPNIRCRIKVFIHIVFVVKLLITPFFVIDLIRNR